MDGQTGRNIKRKQKSWSVVLGHLIQVPFSEVDLPSIQLDHRRETVNIQSVRNKLAVTNIK